MIDNPQQVFPSGDSAALAGQLRRLMGKPHFAGQFRARGLCRVQENYTDQVVARRLYEAFQGILSAKRRG